MTAAGTSWKHYGFDILDGLVGYMDQTEEWVNIEQKDPVILDAEKDLAQVLKKLEGRIDEDEYRDLELQIICYTGTVGNVALLHGIRTGISLLYAIDNPSEMSRYIATQNAQRRKRE